VSWATDGATLLVQHLAPSHPADRRYPTYDPQFLAGGSFRFYDPALHELSRLAAPALSLIDSALTYGRFVSPDEVIFSAHFGTDTLPYYYNRRSGELRAIASQPGTYAAITATSSQTRQIVFFYDSFTEPGEVTRLGWDGQGRTALTDVNAEVRAQSHTRQQAVSFTLRNGQVRTGVLILPADAPNPPKSQRIVVWQEGGPTTSVQNSWGAQVERPFALLPNFGIGVLVTPLEGRYGLGAVRFSALADRANFGQVDIDEQAEIVAQLTARGWAKPGQVGIAGCSYGGYFVTQSITRHPSVYGAAHAMCSLVDTVTEWNRSFDSLMPWLEGLPPFSNLEEYRSDSPLYNAAQARTPLLSFHGEDDFLPVTQMENLHLQLVNREVPAKLLKFVGVGHGLGATREGSEELYSAYEIYGA
jgi:dipeptidyl aminopeptidase/acylaminoacyl peptidase